MFKFQLQLDRELFQWEKDRILLIEPNTSLEQICCVQFYNKKSKISEESIPEGNKVKIPNILLTQNIPLTAVICGVEGEGTQVLGYKTFRVLPRLKPQSYQDDDEEILIFGGGASGTT